MRCESVILPYIRSLLDTSRLLLFMCHHNVFNMCMCTAVCVNLAKVLRASCMRFLNILNTAEYLWSKIANIGVRLFC